MLFTPHRIEYTKEIFSSLIRFLANSLILFLMNFVNGMELPPREIQDVSKVSVCIINAHLLFAFFLMSGFVAILLWMFLILDFFDETFSLSLSALAGGVFKESSN